MSRACRARVVGRRQVAETLFGDGESAAIRGGLRASATAPLQSARGAWELVLAHDRFCPGCRTKARGSRGSRKPDDARVRAVLS